MARKNAPRLEGFAYQGRQRYFVTICTHHRTRVFVTAPAVDVVSAQLLQSATRERFEVLAYCFMPDHLHLLAESVDETGSLEAFVHRFKQLSAYCWKQRTGTSLWQRGYFEHTLREEEDAVGVARYLLANPLRAGLVVNVLDYPFIGSQVMDLRDLIYSVQL